MKKLLAIVLCLIMVLMSISFAFADETAADADGGSQPPLKDVAGTQYEEAVAKLIAENVVNGYPDGTFRPQNKVTRAEAAKMIVLATGEKQTAAGETPVFTDIKGHWAESYVQTAANAGILNGYPDKTFRPEQTVTYYEMAKILVAAKGYTEDQLEGTWPDNYMNKAAELKITANLPETEDPAGSALRGETARMIYNALYKAQQPEEPEKPITPDEKLNLENYGCLYGVINEFCGVSNKDENSVNGVDFLLGKNYYTIPAYDNAGNSALEALKGTAEPDGTLYALRLRKGEISNVATAEQVAADPDAYSWVKTFVELTPANMTDVNGFVKVYEADAAGFLFKSEAGVSASVDLAEKAVVYKLVENDGEFEYEPAKLSDVRKNTKVRLYDVTKDKNEEANVIIIDDRD